ncbi:MAG: hypothetical protein IT363_05885 [Methanoregulaceae archaeon]|nr:hypothetical protein [Methanoregulaceae archaeon]
MRKLDRLGPGIAGLIVLGLVLTAVISYLKFSSEARFAVTLSPPEGFAIISINRQDHRGSGGFVGYLPEGPNTFILERAGVRYAYVVEVLGGFDAYLNLRESDLKPVARINAT